MKIAGSDPFFLISLYFTDCSNCYGQIVAALADCNNENWLQCIQDILGAGNPCIECVCEIIDDICHIFGCDLNCHPTTANPINK